MKIKIAAIMIALLMSTVSFSIFLTGVSVGHSDIAEPMFAGGDGSIGNPYQISNVTELQWMGNVSNLNKNFTLINDIDASITSTWNSDAGFVPIGNNTARFNGSLDGAGYDIINLTINRSAEDYVGLFGYLNESASIDNLGLENVNMTGFNFVGGFAGYNVGTITNCYSIGNASGTTNVGGFVGVNFGGIITNCYSTGSASGNDYVGGFVGYNAGGGTITNCYSTGSTIGTGLYVGGFVGWNAGGGTITNSYSTGSASGTSNIGGFVGENSGSITNCYSTRSAFGTGNRVGGFVGYNTGAGTISNCYSTGSASGNNDVGGFVGWNAGGSVTNCYSTGSASGVQYVGGFVGDNGGTITNSYSTGSASGNYVGGFVGWNNVGTITNCYSTGSASGTGDFVGGFVGQNLGTIMNCYSTGSASGNNDVGGFVGYNAGGGTITNCYSTGSASGTGDFVGGFVGYNAGGGTITNCYSTGSASGTGNYVGGFAGINYDTIVNCYSTGSASGTYGVGGFVGYNSGTITNCYSTGSASGNNDVGGFVGDNAGGGTITNCYSTGSASGTGDFVGGFVGWNVGGSVTNCYSLGYTSGIGANVGGFAGLNSSTITNCFWDTQTSGLPTSGGGTGKTTIEMKQQATFIGWDFTNVWGIVETVTYPFLTPINPIVTTPGVTVMGSCMEDSIYAIGFDCVAQPSPGFNAIVDWSLETNSTGWLSIQSFGILSGTPTNADIGIYYVNITTTDSVGRSGFLNYTLTVMNTAPSITTGDVIITNTGALYEVDYDSTDDPSTTWSLGGNATGWLSIDNNGLLSGTPSNAQADIYNVEVTVNDGNGGTDTRIFTLTVNLDTDGDGDPDETDTDDDNDDYLDIWETFEGTDPVDESDMPVDTDNDGAPDGDAGNTEAWMDTDDDNDGTPDATDDLPTDPTEDTDTDGDGTGNNEDLDDDWDGWSDAIEIAGGFDPLDNTSMPGDEDLDGTADFMDPDFLTTTEYNNNTAYDNNTVYNNNTVNVTADLATDSDSDGWTDIVEILAGTDPDDDTDMPADADDDGIADFMDPDFLTTEVEVQVPVYNNNTIWNNGTADPQTETPIWAWGAVIAAVVMGVLAAVGFMRGGGGGKPGGVEEVRETEPEEPAVEEEVVELEPEV